MKVSRGDIVSRKGSLCEGVEVGTGIDGKSGGVDGELASEPQSDTSEGVRQIPCGRWGDGGDSGDVDGWIAGRR